MPLARRVPSEEQDLEVSLNPMYAGINEATIARFKLSDGELPPRIAAQIVSDELMLDGNARLNLATFVTTWMEAEAADLMSSCFDKNIVDRDEYPQTAELLSGAASTSSPTCGTRRLTSSRWDARRSDRARRRCWAVSRCSGGGEPNGEPRARPPRRQIW